MVQKKNDIDPTIDEIHRTREQTADKFNGDIDAILEDARKRQSASERPVWRGPSPNRPVKSPGDGGQSE